MKMTDKQFKHFNCKLLNISYFFRATQV